MSSLSHPANPSVPFAAAALPRLAVPGTHPRAGAFVLVKPRSSVPASPAPRSGTGSAEGPTQLKLPAGTYKDDNAAVTYSQSDMSDVLTY
ncbi:hypothetical protein ABZ208_30215 [Streptomyces sp. NPDC006208]|uniref:hypothetical protein n=1 Tax=Streptomyces sp. NPDC006208 TaxID=3156734 RepID=UPI0033A45359